MQQVTLNNGVNMPQIGLGTYQMSDQEVLSSVKKALDLGYRSIDTATLYENERAVGEAIRKSDIPRGELFITTKVWNSDHGYDPTLRAFDESMEKLGLDYLDLYLIHWPTPMYDQYIETYKALEHLYQTGRVKAIGVCNFDIDHLERLLAKCDVKPVLNQVECHPYLQQKELKAFCLAHDIDVQSWSPLMQGGAVLTDDVIKQIAKQHNKTEAQIIMRWHIQSQSIVIPKSTTPSRIKENIDVFDFALSEKDMEHIATRDRGERSGPIPSKMDAR